MPKLLPEQVDFIIMMKKVKYSNCEIARILGVTEGAIRYRIRRRESGAEDGRKNKSSAVDRYKALIEMWIEDYKNERHCPTLKALYDMLVKHHGYKNSYDAMRRYVRKNFPEFYRKGVSIRLKAPPGSLLQVDWKEDVKVQLGRWGSWVSVQAMCFVLGFSGKPVVIFRFKKDIEAFISAHQEGLRKIGGLPEVIRTDCLKSAVVKWKGEKSQLNETYRRYVEKLGIAVFPSRPGKPRDKGTVEKRIQDIFLRMDFKHRIYKDLKDLTEQTNTQIEERAKEWMCAATGLTVAKSFEYEKKYLRQLPVKFPVIPVEERKAKVRRDGTVYFGGNYYQVHRKYVDRTVLCINDGQEVSIYYEGENIEKYAYLPGAKGMVRMSEKVLEDPDLHISDTVRAWGLEVARRQVEIYHEITGGVNHCRH